MIANKDQINQKNEENNKKIHRAEYRQEKNEKEKK